MPPQDAKFSTNISQGIHALLRNCPRLTHLSLTGVQAFLRDELLVYCREAPPEFNEHQRDVFCVFSGMGVTRLRMFLNDEAARHAGYVDGETMYNDDGETMFKDDDAVDGMNNVTNQTNGMAIDEMGEGEEEGEYRHDSEMLG